MENYTIEMLFSYFVIEAKPGMDLLGSKISIKALSRAMAIEGTYLSIELGSVLNIV